MHAKQKECVIACQQTGLSCEIQSIEQRFAHYTPDRPVRGMAQQPEYGVT